MAVIAGKGVRGQGDDVRLLACRRPDGALVFPPPEDAGEADLVELPTRGRLWTFTVQRFAPKAPYDGVGADGAFVPFVVGYVAFDAGIAIEGYVFDVDADALEIGAVMHVCARPYRSHDAGAQMVGFRCVDGDAQ